MSIENVNSSVPNNGGSDGLSRAVGMPSRSDSLGLALLVAEVTGVLRLELELAVAPRLQEHAGTIPCQH
jgi:hypothetical protein